MPDDDLNKIQALLFAKLNAGAINGGEFDLIYNAIHQRNRRIAELDYLLTAEKGWVNIYRDELVKAKTEAKPNHALLVVGDGKVLDAWGKVKEHEPNA